MLVRHGESEHGLRRMIAGQAGCLGLTERGFQQAHRLGERLAKTGEANQAVLLSSPVLRAHQTAEVLAASLPLAPLVQDDDLSELLPGEADGLHWESYVAKYGEFDLVSSPTRPFAPGGESWSDFTQRVGATLQRLAQTYRGQTIVAVTHGGFIVTAMLVLFDIPRPGTGARMDPLHTSITEWRVSQQTWRLVRFNDFCHLQDSQP